jgi:hypothetical protein
MKTLTILAVGAALLGAGSAVTPAAALPIAPVAIDTTDAATGNVLNVQYRRHYRGRYLGPRYGGYWGPRYRGYWGPRYYGGGGYYGGGYPYAGYRYGGYPYGGYPYAGYGGYRSYGPFFGFGIGPFRFGFY